MSTYDVAEGESIEPGDAVVVDSSGRVRGKARRAAPVARIYDRGSVQVTIGGVPFEGFTSVEYSAPPALRAGVDGTALARVVGRASAPVTYEALYGPRPGTRRWLAEEIRRFLPEPVLVVIDESDGFGVVRATVAPDRDGVLDASTVTDLRVALRSMVPLVVDLRIEATTRAALLCEAGARAVLDWMVRRSRPRP